MSRPDVTVENHGSIILVRMRTLAAQTWADENLPGDCPRMGNGYAVEPRHVGPILDGMVSDGLQIG
jgi:hypothetical protein